MTAAPAPGALVACAVELALALSLDVVGDEDSVELDESVEEESVEEEEELPLDVDVVKVVEVPDVLEEPLELALLELELPELDDDAPVEVAVAGFAVFVAPLTWKLFVKLTSSGLSLLMISIVYE